jgi:formylglycine-generating enzyme required for sulfatase activity
LHEDEKSRPGIEVDLLGPPEKNRTLLIGVFAIAALVILSGAAGLVWILFLRDPGPSSAAAVITGSGPSNPQAQTEPPAGMVFVPAGEFTMGTDKSIDEIKQDTPAHKVTAGPFFIDLTEVTNEDYQKFVAASSHRPPPDWSGQNFPQGKAKFPVTGVDWDDAGAYAKWAEKRLPTEEEWEFAAHSDGKIYPWGDEWKNEYANANKQRSVMLEVGKTTGRSRLGLADMIGNAWEWTASDTRAYSGGKEFDDDSMTDPKVIRGGFWGSSKEKATATVRRAYGARNEKDGYSNTGFRCVKDAPQN